MSSADDMYILALALTSNCVSPVLLVLLVLLQQQDNGVGNDYKNSINGFNGISISIRSDNAKVQEIF